MSGKVVPAGGLPWQDAQLPVVSGEAAWWQTVHRGAAERGEGPVTAWQVVQFAAKLTWVAAVWVVARNGTGWSGAPGPLGWQATALTAVEKQLGAAGFGALRPLV